jgi:hypothetical protein
MMSCQECGADNPNGTVFCLYCKSRIVLSDSDAPVSLPDVDRPYYSVQVFGRTRSYDVGRYAFSYITWPLVGGAISVIILLAILGWITALTLIIWLGAYFAVTYALLLAYQMTKSPLDFGGSGVSPLPCRSEVELIESDHMKRRTKE